MKEDETMNNAMLSVIIPTRNRQKYCARVVEQILNATGSDVEIVIQDNSDDNSLEGVFNELNSKRLVYNYEQRVLSFVDNFSAAVELAHGEYLCMIGDDDGVLPNIMDAVRHAKKKDLDALIPGLNSVYFWPSENPIVKGGEQGYLVLSYINDECRSVDTINELKKLLAQGFQDYQSTNVPRLYHGIVHRRVLEKIKSRVGTYFGGLTPDMYMAVALAIVSEKVETIGFPITISGICPKSGSAASATGAHTGRLEDAPHFKGHESYEWSEQVPAVYSVETIWGDTGIQALRDFGQAEMVNKACVNELHVRLWAGYPQFRKEIAESVEKNSLILPAIQFKALLYKPMRFVRRAWRRVTRKKADVRKLYNVFDIQVAEKMTMDAIRSVSNGWETEE